MLMCSCCGLNYISVMSKDIESSGAYHPLHYLPFCFFYNTIWENLKLFKLLLLWKYSIFPQIRIKIVFIIYNMVSYIVAYLECTGFQNSEIITFFWLNVLAVG